MKKILQITLIVFLLSGCSTVKQGWKDFTAYYNTFYNTKQFFNDGLQKNRRQVPPLNPMAPIRIHQPPSNAGHDDFQQAIERGSSILLNHNESKYVLPAIVIIGKSYYYRSEYFAALEKFSELQTLGSESDQQIAILWQGLTYLEMENYAEGIRFLEIETELIEEWDPEIRAEIHAVLAQLYTATGNVEEAITNLRQAISGIEDRDMLARAHFLLGQVFELNNRDNQALFAYSQISSIRTNFELEYHALRKQAEVSRRIGNFQQAEHLYRNMRRDDKFVDYRNELQYEIARTLHERGETDAAIHTYNEVLGDQIYPPSNLTRALTYYGLGELFRDQVEDYTLAAAYFDSASSQRVDSDLLPERFNAADLAESFGQYAEIRRQINEKDSLLHLATLPPDELDEFVAELQRIEMEKLEDELQRMEDERNQLIVTEEPDSVIDATESTEFGFLNINSQTMLADASLQFQAVWGDRPLADNWRRRSDVSGSRFDQIVIVDEDEEEITLAEETTDTGVMPTIDLSAVPFTDEEQQQMRSEITDLYYRLANVFFLSLDMPERAVPYYQNVVDNSDELHLKTMAIYSMAEIDLLNNDYNAAINKYEQLQQLNPQSIYSRRLAGRLNIDVPEDTEPSEEESITEEYLQLISVSDTSQTANRADELVRLADNGTDDSQRAILLFEAAREYMSAAKKEDENHDEMVDAWFQLQQEFNDRQTELAELKDSSQVVLSDTTLTDTERNYWQAIADSTLNNPDFSEHFPFEGAYWDSTRSLLTRIETQYASNSTIMPRVRVLKETLQKPETPPEMVNISDELPEEIDRTLEDSEAVADCQEIGIRMNYDGGMEAFMNVITFPSWTENISMRGEVVYRFEISPDGEVIQYEQLSRMDRSGIPQSIENAIDRLLEFEPTGRETPVQCSLTFPIDL